MADENNPQNGAVDPNAPQFVPQVVYLKDVSFESPMGPRIPQNGGNPNVNMNLNTSINQLGEELFEVLLSINVHSTMEDKTIWLCEVKQAGAFAVRNIPEAELRRILGVFCPNYLLPYARQTISDMLLKGGFPPFLLPPVNFDALFDQAAQQNAPADAANQATVN
ncbi:MAG: protein-export chaperone SecB [Steroidobacteraceae bacterium]